MKTHKSKRVYRVRCKSGLIGWRTRLQNNYWSGREFSLNNEAFGLAKRLGFNSAKEAWKSNPVIEGSTNPADFRKVKA